MPNPFAIPVKSVARFQTDDALFNRFQDQLLGVLHAFMKQVSERLGVAPVFDAGSRPAADASVAGMVIRFQREGQEDEVQVCVADATGHYFWQSVMPEAPASSGTGGSTTQTPSPPEASPASWAALGVWVAPSPPTATITYSQWFAGVPGYWAWIQT